MVTRYFTFGYGHSDPITGASLADKYAKITARSEQECRDYMFAIYGNQWAFDYTPKLFEAMQREPHLTVTLHIEVTLHG